MKRLFFLLITILSLELSAKEVFTKTYADMQNAASFELEFPFLAKLMVEELPWEMEPAQFVAHFFSHSATMTQGDREYPLHFSSQRDVYFKGEPLFGEFAYETEYYCFDKANPVVKLHIGRPVLSSRQMGRVDEVARGMKMAERFPYLDIDQIAPLLSSLNGIADRLIAYGAVEVEAGDHFLVRNYQLPNGITMRVTNLSGSTNGTPYVEVTLQPTSPVAKFEGTQELAFPTAEGFGRYARGGRGGKVYVVTSLEDYLPNGRAGRDKEEWGQPSAWAPTLGEDNYRAYVDALGALIPNVWQPLLPEFAAIEPEAVIHGTLREAIEADGPRIVIFAVSGDIDLKENLVIENPYITIAGQTAPGEGIQIRNWGIKIETHDVILRNLRIRVGDRKGPGDTMRTLGEQTHALDVKAMNIMIDHCEMAYANDQVFNTYGNHRRLASTIQWCYIYGAPKRSTHEKGDHSMSVAGNGWGYVSFHHNLIAHGGRRNPRLDSSVYDYRNNVLYNHEGSSGYGSPNDYLQLNYIGSTIKKGPNSARANTRAFSEPQTYGQFYGADNKLPQSAEEPVFDVPARNLKTTPHRVAPVVTHSAAEAYQQVLIKGGVNTPTRDAITQYVAKTVLEGTGFIPNSATDWPLGGFAVYDAIGALPDSSGDGMPDEWKRQMGLDLQRYEANGRDLNPSYDNIEVYVNSLVGE